MKNPVLSTIYPRFTLIKSMACSLALLASGQALAATYYSTATGDFNALTTWSSTACNGATATIAPSPTDSYMICTGYTVTLTAPATADSVGMNGGTLVLGSNALTVTNVFVSMMQSTVTSGATTHQLARASLSAGTLGNIDLGNANVTGDVTVMGDLVTLGSGAVVGGNVSLFGASSKLTLTAGSTVSGNVTTDGNGLLGTLKFTAGNKTITASTAATIPVLDLSLMAIGNTITTATNTVTFGSVTGKKLECPAATPYSAGSAIPAGTTCTVAAAPIVNAPIDLNFSNTPETFATEIEVKQLFDLFIILNLLNFKN